MLTGETASDISDPDVDADAERRQNIIRDIDAMIDEYRKQLQ